MRYASVQIDDEEVVVIELSDEGFCEAVDWDDGRVRLGICHWRKDMMFVGGFFSHDYLTLGRARTSWRRSVAGEKGEVIGKYTVAVFATREEAENFDKNDHTWIPDPSRGGLHEAFLKS